MYTGNGLGVYTGDRLGVYTGISHNDQWQRSQCTPPGQPQCTPSGQPQCAPPTAGPQCTPPVYTRSITQACSMSDPNALLRPRIAASMCTRWRTTPCVHQPSVHPRRHGPCTPTHDQPQCAINGHSTQQVFLTQIVTLYLNYTSRIKCDEFRNPKV